MEPDADTVQGDKSSPGPYFDGHVAAASAGVSEEATKGSDMPLDSSDASEPSGVAAGASHDQLAVSESADDAASSFIPEPR